MSKHKTYDTTKDTDGGSWRKRFKPTRWSKSPARWLGEHPNETAARAVVGATTSDYYYNTTDGKFYSLNAGSGETTALLGNRQEVFPEQVAEHHTPVAEITYSDGKSVYYSFSDSCYPKEVSRADMREAFEKWWAEEHPEGVYAPDEKVYAKAAWNAAIASLEPAFWVAPESLPMDRPADHIYVTNEEADGCCVPVYVVKKGE